jgi:cytoskeletal protein RodZ
MAGSRPTIPDLASIRVSRKLSLQQIAGSTKIAIPYLRAIERGEIRQLPPGIFTSSYVRQYARAIDYDEQDLLSQLGLLAPPPSPAVRPAASPSSSRPGTRLAHLFRKLSRTAQ